MTHAVVASFGGIVFTKKRMPFRFWYLAIVCSIIPDADVIGFYFEVQYGDFFGHRGFFHSIFFALVLSIVVVFAFLRDGKVFSKGKWKYILFFFTVMASHGLLDAFTNGGLGIALLSPFDNTRYFSPWTPIMVSPISLGAFLSHWGFRVIVCEIIYVWLPLLTFLLVFRTARSKFGRQFETRGG